MPVIDSPIDTQSDEFNANHEAMLTAINTFRAIEQNVIAKSQEKRERYEKRGKMLPHDRVAHLLDAGSPFLSLMNLAGYKMHDDKDGTEAGGGLIAGIGYVRGVRCLVSASNFAIKGG